MNSPFDETLLRRVEDAGLNASAPPQQRWLDGWLVRYNAGKAKRARCINAVAPGHRPWADKLRECQSLFDEVGLPLVVRITPYTEPPGLDQALEQQGWARFDDTRVMVLPGLEHLPLAETPRGVDAHFAAFDEYAQVVGALRGTPQDQIEAHALRMAHSPIPYRGLVWQRGPEVLACGQFAREGDLAGLYDVFTTPAARGQGLARALCTALLTQARAEGARGAYLQVDAANAPARAVYHRLGFADGYAYHYRAANAEAAHG